MFSSKLFIKKKIKYIIMIFIKIILYKKFKNNLNNK